MKKLGEGSFNRVFLMQFDNGRELLARIPCPVAGNLPLATASEAATMEYVRLRYPSGGGEVPSFPKIPKVLAWDSSFENPAAWPYIICEHLPGITLDKRWFDIGENMLKEVIHDIVLFESDFRQEGFSQHGSIFFAESVSEELCERPLYAEPPTDEFQMALARRFRIGPSVNREWWRGPYEKITGGRGPWPDFPSMMLSAAEFQLRCLDNGIDHTSPFSESTGADVPLLRHVLGICIDIAPLVSRRGQLQTQPVLSHPDLSVCNFIVPAEGDPKIDGVIDWQGAVVAPFFMQCRPATGMVHVTEAIKSAPDGSPILPENFDSLSAEEQDNVRRHMGMISRFRYYFLDAVATYPRRRSAWGIPLGMQMPNLIHFILRCIADGPVQLCDLLVKMQGHWQVFSDEPCPIGFSPEEKEVYRVRYEEWHERQVLDQAVANEVGGMGDGWVEEEGFDDGKRKLEELKRVWDREMDRPFPLFDGAPSPYLS